MNTYLLLFSLGFFGARAWSILWSIALLAARAWSILLSIALFGEQARASFRVSACWEQRFLNVEIYNRVSVFGEYVWNIIF